MNKLFRLISIGILITIFFTSCNSVSLNQAKDSEIFVMNTYVSQKVYGKNSEQAINNVNDCLIDIESKLSMYVSGSDIDKINKSSGEAPVKVNTYTYDIVKKSTEYSKLSNGLFDITIAPLTSLWAITSDNPKIPKQSDINDAVKLIDYNKIIFDSKNKTIMLKDKGMAIDLGGVAKGYICTIIKQEYEKLNVEGALVSIGGNIYAFKAKPDKSQFTLGLRDPLASPNDIVGKLKVKDKVVATSGAYERFFEKDGKIYHHILDIETGYPVDSDLLSATIVSNDGGLADYLSTTVYISGVEHIKDYINNEEFEVIIIDRNKNVYVSDSLKSSFELTNNNYKLYMGNSYG